eukprot:TRINITY_DN56092_c0_g1_i1.p1 TRINITY_DN56092_c0_g1~~TRINITY_DN56092_c0_g1_i1.p1  ORF type:complete len:267 (-),score=41.82 TRINITY_DN56092_c0_g1_i1:505-1305(-)
MRFLRALVAAGRGTGRPYGDPRYWEQRFSGKAGPFGWLGWRTRFPDEWYCTYDDIRPKFKELVEKTARRATTADPLPVRVLVIGNGLSTLAENIVTDSVPRNGEICEPSSQIAAVVAVDVSETAVARQQERWAELSDAISQKLNFTVADATSVGFPEDAIPDHFPQSNGGFDIVVDKGTLDAVICGDDGEQQGKRLVNGAMKALRPGGYFLCVCVGEPGEDILQVAEGQSETIWKSWKHDIIEPHKPYHRVDVNAYVLEKDNAAGE